MTSRTVGIVAWLVANRKAVVSLTAHAGGRLGLVGATRAAVYPMRNYECRLVTTSFRPINPLSLPGRWVTISSVDPLRSSVQFSSIQFSSVQFSSVQFYSKFSSQSSGNRFPNSFGIYWATVLFLRTPFTEGCAGANKKASPPGRHQEQTSQKHVALLDPLRSVQFSSVQFSSVQFSSV